MDHYTYMYMKGEKVNFCYFCKCSEVALINNHLKLKLREIGSLLPVKLPPDI